MTSMSMVSINNNKEFFELLDGTDSHSGCEVQQLVIPPRKKRFRRRLRNNPNTRHQEDSEHCRCSARTISLTLFCIVLVSWLITLTWLAVVLHRDINRLNSEVQEMVAAHRGVPDALHQCHSLSRELHKNQTAIFAKLASFTPLLGNISVNLTELQTALSAVQQQLNVSPKRFDPQITEELSKTVATFGSKIQDLETTASSLKEQHTKQDGVISVLSSNLTELHTQVAGLAADRGNGGVSASELAAAKDAILGTVGLLQANVTRLNSTLTRQLQWTADDQSKERKTLDGLQEMNQNLTARVSTLEGLCSKPTAPPLPPAPGDSSASATAVKQDPTPGVFASLPQQETNGREGGNVPAVLIPSEVTQRP